MRSRLRWLAPLLSTVVLGVLIARATSCDQRARAPAVVVRDPETRVEEPKPAGQAVVRQPPSAAADPVDAGLGASLPESLPSLRDQAFLGGSKSGLGGLGLRHGGLGLHGNEAEPAAPEAGE